MTPGRRFRMQLSQSRASRLAALATVAETCGVWVARVGGPARGVLVHGTTRAAVEARVNDHYSAALLRRIRRDHAEE